MPLVALHLHLLRTGQPLATDRRLCLYVCGWIYWTTWPTEGGRLDELRACRSSSGHWCTLHSTSVPLPVMSTVVLNVQCSAMLVLVFLNISLFAMYSYISISSSCIVVTRLMQISCYLLLCIAMISPCTWTRTRLLICSFELVVTPSLKSLFSCNNTTLPNAHTKLNLS
jgi:hypothetical protein